MLPCKTGCKCGKHKHPGPFGLMSEKEVISAKQIMSLKKGASWKRGDYAHRINGATQRETQLKIRATLQEGFTSGRLKPPKGAGYRNFSGASLGDKYAALLCPVGYRREYAIWTGRDRDSTVKLDFALLESKVNIEIDGPWYVGTPSSDTERDIKLQKLGWKVIRVKEN